MFCFLWLTYSQCRCGFLFFVLLAWFRLLLCFFPTTSIFGGPLYCFFYSLRFFVFFYLRRLPMQSVVIRAFQNYLLICFGCKFVCVWVLHRVTPGIINRKLKCPLNVDAKIVVVWTLSHFCTLRATSIFLFAYFALFMRYTLER